MMLRRVGLGQPHRMPQAARAEMGTPCGASGPRGRRARTRAVALVGALLLPAVGAPAAAQEIPIGLITHLTDASTTRLLRQANVRHVKTTLYWSRWEGETAYRDAFAEGIARLADAGFEITVVVHAPPPGSSAFEEREGAYDRFAVFVGARAAQFPAVRNWQLWNEPDAPGWTALFGAGRLPVREQGRLYGRMLARAHPRVRAANPGARVVIGGLAGPDDSIGVFLRGIYDARGPFDVAAVHAYGPPVWKAARDRGAAVRAVMREHRDTRPLWLTEFGVSDAAMRKLWRLVDDAARDRRQAEEWRRVAEWNDGARTYDRLIGYALQDEPGTGYGIVGPDGRRLRPAYRWLQARNRERAPTP